MGLSESIDRNENVWQASIASKRTTQPIEYAISTFYFIRFFHEHSLSAVIKREAEFNFSLHAMVFQRGRKNRIHVVRSARKRAPRFDAE